MYFPSILKSSHSRYINILKTCQEQFSIFKRKDIWHFDLSTLAIHILFFLSFFFPPVVDYILWYEISVAKTDFWILFICVFILNSHILLIICWKIKYRAQIYLHGSYYQLITLVFFKHSQTYIFLNMIHLLQYFHIYDCDLKFSASPPIF